MNRPLTKSVLLALFAALALLASACAGVGSSQTAQAPEDTEGSPASEPETASEEAVASTETEPAVAAAGGEEHDDAAEAHEEALAAQESPEDSKKAAASGNGQRTIRVEMTEFAYEPSKIKVKKGETVRFVFRNTGAVEHEALIGDRHVQAEHEAEMLAGDADHGDGHHGEVSNIRLGPGEKGTLEHTFQEAGKLILGCHLPGHWDAGMKATIDVQA